MQFVNRRGVRCSAVPLGPPPVPVSVPVAASQQQQQPQVQEPQAFINRQGALVSREGIILNRPNNLNQRVLGNVIVFDPNDPDPASAPLNPSQSVSTLLRSFTLDEHNPEVSVYLRWNDIIERHLMRKHMPFNELLSKIALREGTNTASVILMMDDHVIMPDDSPDSIGYRVSKVITGRIVAELSAAKKKKNLNMIKVKVQAAGIKKPLLCTIDKAKKFEQCMPKIVDFFKTDQGKIKLKFDGDFINLENTPQDLDFEGGEVIDCIIVP